MTIFTEKLKQTITQIEKEYLQIIIENLKNGNLKLEEAKKHTKEFLALLPFSSFDDFKKKISDFVLKHPIYQKIYLSLLKIEEEEKTQELLNRMTAFIKENKIKEVLKVVAK